MRRRFLYLHYGKGLGFGVCLIVKKIILTVLQIGFIKF